MLLHQENRQGQGGESRFLVYSVSINTKVHPSTKTFLYKTKTVSSGITCTEVWSSPTYTSVTALQTAIKWPQFFAKRTASFRLSITHRKPGEPTYTGCRKLE